MTELDKRVRRSARIAARVVNGQAVIVIIDTRDLHTLNEVGTFVWESLGEEGRPPVSELVDAVAAEFDVERARAEVDVLAFVESMATLGAIQLEGAEA